MDTAGTEMSLPGPDVGEPNSVITTTGIIAYLSHKYKSLVKIIEICK